MSSSESLALAAQFAKAWLAPDEHCDISVLGRGLINQTYRVTTAGGRDFVLQRLSRHIFPRPEAIQDNLRRLHLDDEGQHCRLPEVLACQHDPSSDHMLEADTAVWRAMSYIPGAKALSSLDSPLQAERVGQLLGDFHQRLAGLAPLHFHDTLPGFHVTPLYYASLRQACAEVEVQGVSSTEMNRLLAFVSQRRVLLNVLESARASGLLRERVIHGDPKLDNMLFDEITGEPLAMVDLDTVKPGLVHYDIADCLRSACLRGGELSGLENVCFDLDIAESILRGYLAVAGSGLNGMDRHLLVPAIILLPLELGIRFLTDHLRGDIYFRVQVRGENLHKAAVQFALVESIESLLPEVRFRVARLLRELP